MTGNPGSKFAHHAESPALTATRGSRLLLYRCAEAFGYMQEQRQRGGATYESHEDEPIVLVAERRSAGGCTGRFRRRSCRSWRWLCETRQTGGHTTPATMTTATPQRLTATLYREDEVYVAECPEVGTASQGDTIEEALANLREATELYLEECPQPALAPRLLTTFEVNVA